MPVDIDIAVESDAWSAVPDLEALVRRSIDAATVMAEQTFPAETELSVLFCDDAAIKLLNRDWRGVDKPTNVLSFPAVEPEARGGPRLLGDIAVAFETTRGEAAREGKSIEAHLSHLLVHGFLHLLDHDHADDADATAMEGLEVRILARLGIADPYAGSEPAEVNNL